MSPAPDTSKHFRARGLVFGAVGVEQAHAFFLVRVTSRASASCSYWPASGRVGPGRFRRASCRPLGGIRFYWGEQGGAGVFAQSSPLGSISTGLPAARASSTMRATW